MVVSQPRHDLARFDGSGKAGDLKVLTRGRLRERLEVSARSRNITIRMQEGDIERARRLAEKKGIGYQTYMKILLREALDREDRKTGKAARGSPPARLHARTDLPVTVLAYATGIRLWEGGFVRIRDVGKQKSVLSRNTAAIAANSHGRDRIGSVVGTADQRAGFHVAEAHFVAGAAEVVELGGRHVAHDGEVLRRGAQVLSQRQDVDAVRAEVAHD